MSGLDIDSGVSFHQIVKKNHHHHTWARTFHSQPEFFIVPRSLSEIQDVVNLAREHHRRLVVVGSSHSPSDLTCSSAWMVSLDCYNSVERVDKDTGIMIVQAGIRLHELNAQAAEHGLTMPNLGSINEQSIAGAIATATHGSSLRHGLLSSSVRSLRLVLANGEVTKCSATENPDQFCAALVSLGALGIVVEVEFQMVKDCRIEWKQSISPISEILANWEKSFWTEKEYTRFWWIPYGRRAIVWKAEKTSKPIRRPGKSWYGRKFGYHVYHVLLWISNYVPRILPYVERFVFGMQYGFRAGPASTSSAIEPLRDGLLMDCLSSQFVNEWAIPLNRGPEAITRLGAWLNGEQEASQIPFSSKNVYVHFPIEVRVSNTNLPDLTQPRPFLDSSMSDGPTLYLNATLYRPYGNDPPCKTRYYEAFEWLMRDLGGRPHWAKNFGHAICENDITSDKTDSDSSESVKTCSNSPFSVGLRRGINPPFSNLYGSSLQRWLQVRAEVDPDGMFVGPWHRRYLLSSNVPVLPFEEKLASVRPRHHDGLDWIGSRVHDV